MQHRFTFRRTTQADVNWASDAAPDDEQFEFRMEAMASDAQWIEGVTESRRVGQFEIMISSHEELEVVKEKLVPLLRHYWDYLRIVL